MKRLHPGSASKQTITDAITVRTDSASSPKRRRIESNARRPAIRVDLVQEDDTTRASLQPLLTILREKKNIVVIVGAGISVSAGIPDFRSKDGIFKTTANGKQLFDASVYNHNASTEVFHEMIQNLVQKIETANHTPFHLMLATMANQGRLRRLYTQNIDGLEVSLQPLATHIPLPEKEPWPVTIQLHGGLDKMECHKCHHISKLDSSLFKGPEPPLCEICEETDSTRAANGQRRHGVGRLRPRITLYNEASQDADAIGNVWQADVDDPPDAVIVVGTSLAIPDIRKLVTRLCHAARIKGDGATAWLNLEPEQPSTKQLWDFVIRGTSDELAALVDLPRWECGKQDCTTTFSRSMNEAQHDTTLQHILAFRPDLESVPEYWIRQHTTQKDPLSRPQDPLQIGSEGCDCYWIAIHNVLGMEVPQPVNHLAVQAFCRSIATNIDQLSSGKEANLVSLWDALRIECAESYRHQCLPLEIHNIKADIKDALESADTIEAFTQSQRKLEEILDRRRTVFDSHIAAQITKTSRQQAAVEQCLGLSGTLQTADQGLNVKLNEANHGLGKVRQYIKTFDILGIQQELEKFMERGHAAYESLKIEQQKRARLLKAVEAALNTVADHLRTEMDYLEQQRQG